MKPKKRMSPERRREYDRERYAKNERSREVRKQWAKANPEKVAAYRKVTVANGAEKAREYQKAYYRKNREKKLAECKARYIPKPKKERTPPKPATQRTREWKQRNPAKAAAGTSRYRAENIEKVREWRRAAHKRLMQSPEGVITKRLRQRLRDEIRFRPSGIIKKASALNLVGCTVAELRVHLERQFKPGMGWHNRSDWHIDHIRPCDSFNLLDEEEQRKCFHFSNLQPLWKSENCRKGAKLILFKAA